MAKQLDIPTSNLAEELTEKALGATDLSSSKFLAFHVIAASAMTIDDDNGFLSRIEIWQCTDFSFHVNWLNEMVYI